MIEVSIPQFGETIKEVTISDWHKKTGDWINRDEVICEIESEKATLEVTAEQSGILYVLIDKGQEAKVGQIFYKIDISTEVLIEEAPEIKKKGEINIKRKEEKISSIRSDIKADSLIEGGEYEIKNEQKTLFVRIHKKYLTSYILYNINHGYYSSLRIHDLQNYEIKETEKTLLKGVADKLKDRVLFPRKMETSFKMLSTIKSVANNETMNQIEIKPLSKGIKEICEIKITSEKFGTILPDEIDSTTFSHIRNMSCCNGIEYNLFPHGDRAFSGDITLLPLFESILKMFGIQIEIKT